MTDDFGAIRRFELIDHTQGTVTHYPDQPRTLTAKDVIVTWSLQDGGDTLKIFLFKESYETDTGQRPPA